MKWKLHVRTSDFSEYELIAANGDKIVFKYNRLQEILRLRFHDQHAVYSLDHVNFEARKFTLKNIYGSEIGSVTKALWNERSGYISFDGLLEKISYRINSDHTSLKIFTDHAEEATCEINPTSSRELMMLVLISLSWNLSIGVTKTAQAVYL
jgi:hypothetical protein